MKKTLKIREDLGMMLRECVDELQRNIKREKHTESSIIVRVLDKELI